MAKQKRAVRDEHEGMELVKGVWVPKGHDQGCPSTLLRGSKGYREDPITVGLKTATRLFFQEVGRNALATGE